VKKKSRRKKKTSINKPPQKEKLPEQNPPKPAALPVRNILLFAVLVLLGNAPLWISADIIMVFREFMAWLVGCLINISGLQVVVEGVYLTFANERWVMTPECTALTAMIVFAAFVIVYPARVKSKGIALAVGIPFIILSNLVRLLTLAWATKWFPRYAHWIHDYVWQVAFLMLITVMWLIWIEVVVKCEEKTAVST